MIGDILKEIFVPDMDEFRQEFLGLVNKVSPNGGTYAGPGGGADGGGFGGGNIGETVVENQGFFGSLSGAEGKEPTNVYMDYDFGLFKLDGVKIVDYSTLKSAVDFFRPIINGFILVLLGWYWYREFLSFIGQAPNMAKAKADAEE